DGQPLSDDAKREQQSDQGKRLPFLGARDPCGRANGTHKQDHLGAPEKASLKLGCVHVVGSVVLNGRRGVVLEGLNTTLCMAAPLPYPHAPPIPMPRRAARHRPTGGPSCQPSGWAPRPPAPARTPCVRSAGVPPR